MKSKNFGLLIIVSSILFTTFLINIKIVSSTTSTLSTDPEIAYEAPGDTFYLNITVSSVEYLYDWQVNITFNPTVLHFVNVTEGDFLARQPEGTFGALKDRGTGWAMFGWTTLGVYIGESGSGTLATIEFEVLTIGESILKFINQTEGVGYTFLEAQLSPNAPPNFEDIEFTAIDGLFTNTVVPPVPDFTYSPEFPAIGELITFDGSASSATSPLEIVEYYWDFGDGTNETVSTPTVQHAYSSGGIYKISLTVIDNATASDLVKSVYNTDDMPRVWYEHLSTKELTLGIALPHDVAITNVVPSAEQVTVGETLTIDVTVSNRGTEQEDVSVTAYYGTTAIDTKQVTDLNPGDDENLVFSWDTTGVAAGNYQIKAVAQAVAGEENLLNNEFIDGTIAVTGSTDSIPWTLIIAGVVVAVVVVVVALFFLRRRRSTPSPA